MWHRELFLTKNPRKIAKAVLPMSRSVRKEETERSFYCLSQIHTWLCTTMTEEILGNLWVLALHGVFVLRNF